MVKLLSVLFLDSKQISRKILSVSILVLAYNYYKKEMVLNDTGHDYGHAWQVDHIVEVGNENVTT